MSQEVSDSRRFFDLAPERRERILTAAAHEFAEHGYAAASLNRIIDALESAAGTFWNTFRDVMRRSLGYMEDDAYIRLARSFHQLRSTAPASSAAERVIDTISEYVKSIIERGQALGVVRTDVPVPLLVEVTLAVDEAGDRWRLQEWDRFSPEERVAHADAQIDLMRDMLHADNQGWEEPR